MQTLAPSADYQPCLHIDVYGTIGQMCNNNAKHVAEYIASLEKAAGPLSLYIEGPVDAGGKEAQIEEMGKITAHLSQLGSSVKLVADEWCNTYEDIVDFTDAKCCHMVQIKTRIWAVFIILSESVLYCNSHNMSLSGRHLQRNRRFGENLRASGGCSATDAHADQTRYGLR